METLRRLLRPKGAASFNDLKINRYIEVTSRGKEGWAYVAPSGLLYRKKSAAVFVLYTRDDTTLYPFEFKALPHDHAQMLFFELFFQHVLTMPARPSSVVN